MKTVLISSAVVLSAITFLLLVWQLFGGQHRKQAQIELPSDVVSALAPDPPKVYIWESLWMDEAVDRNETKLGWMLTLPRRFYDPEYQNVLLNRKWKAAGAKYQKQKSDKAVRGDFDGLREKRASSIVTYFCIFVLVLSLIRAALDMNSNLKKSREENVNQTINLDSRRCSLNDFKLAQAQLKKKEECQRRAYLLNRAMTIVESPSELIRTEKKATVSQSMNNLDAKEGVINSIGKEKAVLEKQPSISEGSGTDSPTKLRPRFSTMSPTPSHLRRMSFPALRRGSSMDVVHADMDDLIANHSPEVKRRMRLLRH